MAPNGDITIFGDNISLEADEINFSGPVNKEITAPPAAPVAAAATPLKVTAIEEFDPAPYEEEAAPENIVEPAQPEQKQQRQVIDERDLVIGYEFHADEPFDDDDRFVLKATDGSWSQELIRKSVGGYGIWLELVFTNVPQNKVFNLFYIPQDTSLSPFVLLHEFEYADLVQKMEYPTFDEGSE